MKTIRERAIDKQLLIAAHRGSSGTAPENTLAAFKEAMEAGADIVEADIQMTSDGYVVAFHDKNLSRTTTGSGRLKDMSYNNINQLDAGDWFSDKFKGEGIPLLSDIIKLIKGKCYLNIEVKNIEGNDLGEKIKKIIDIITEQDFSRFTVFSSFYYDTLFELKKQNPEFPTAAIRIPKDTRPPSQLIREVGCDAFICSLDELTNDVVEDIKNNHIFTACYLIDTKEDLDKVLNLPVRAIVTNYPAKIKEMLNQ